jgi:plasmid stability protein
VVLTERRAAPLQFVLSLTASKSLTTAAARALESEMGVLTVRALDNALIRELRIRAARHGSAEAEHRLILEAALRPRRKPFKTIARHRRQSLKGRNFFDSTDIIRRFRDEEPT